MVLSQGFYRVLKQKDHYRHIIVYIIMIFIVILFICFFMRLLSRSSLDKSCLYLFYEPMSPPMVSA
jgi:hypothetical protein